MEQNASKRKRNWLLPVSILAAAILVAVAIVFLAGKASGNQAANLPGASQMGDLTKLQPITSSDHIVGSANAPVKIIEFADLECPYCKSFHQTLKQITQEYATSVAWVFRHYPIPQIHSKAPYEAQATECAAKLGGNGVYWKYLDSLYYRTPSNNSLDPAALPEIAIEVGLNVDQFNACLSSTYGQDIVNQQAQEAVAVGAFDSGTPYSVVILQNPLSQGAMNAINALNAQYPSNPPVFEVAADKKIFTIRGAMPLEAMQQFFSKLTAN